MVVQHNMTASNASRMLNLTNSSIGATQEELSSGYKINRSSDDAAGLSISEKMRKQIRGLDRASTNIQDGISLVQVADGALTETHDMLQRMNELCVQAANGTNSETDRKDIQYEISQLRSEIDRIAKTTNFNGDIYPLNADTNIKDIDFVDAVSDNSPIQYQDVVVTNDKTGPAYINGKLVNPGEKITLKDVAFFDYNNGNFKNIGWNAVMGNSSGSAGILYRNDSVNLSTINLSNNYDDNGILTSSTVITVKDRIFTDTNGYKFLITFDDLTDVSDLLYTSSRTYFSTIGLTMQTSGYKDDSDFAALEKELGISFDLNMYYTQKEINFTHIDGRQNDKLFLQTTNEANEGVTVQGVNATAKTLGVDTLDITTEAKATAAIDTVGEAIKRVSGMRSYFGAVQNRLEHSVKNVDNVVENTQAAESRIRDTDMADAMVRFSKDNILMQAGQSMLAQANTDQQSVMSLLQ